MGKLKSSSMPIAGLRFGDGGLRHGVEAEVLVHGLLGHVEAAAEQVPIHGAFQSHIGVNIPDTCQLTKVGAAAEIAPETIEHTRAGIRIRATVKTTGQTGVEMEALTAASVAALTVYDMLKAAEKSMTIDGFALS